MIGTFKLKSELLIVASVVSSRTSMFESGILGVLMINTCWGKGVHLEGGDEGEDEGRQRGDGVPSVRRVRSQVFE